MIEIDGSFGEGGGQILRTALSLSCLLKRPFRISNIRKARRKPGLRPQHLTAVRASALVSDGSVEGDREGSTELLFRPGTVRAGDYYFDIGTAGSTGLLAQSLLPPLIFSGGHSTLTLEGGTHVPMSPPYHYISEVFLPMIHKLGIDVSSGIESYGFYPRGGGRVRFNITPCGGVKNADLTDRGELLHIRGLSAVGRLPLGIAERQRKSALAELEAAVGSAPVDIRDVEVPTPGQGTFVFILAVFENSIAGFSALGERGKRAEAVGKEATREFLGFYRSGAAIDRHMADQISLCLALAKGRSMFKTEGITEHLKTNLWVIGKFLPVKCGIDASGKVAIET